METNRQTETREKVIGTESSHTNTQKSKQTHG